MIKKLFAIFVSFSALTISTANAQNGELGVEYFRDGQNNIIRAGSYTDVEGTPFLYKTWMPGTATAADGKVYDNLKLNYNLLDDVLLFKYDSEDKEMKFEKDIVSFNVKLPVQATYANRYPEIDKQTAATYYEVLSSNGKTALLKYSGKTINAVKNYDATVTKKFQDITAYYVFKNGKMQKLNKSKDSVLNVLADKKDQLQTYVKTNPVNFKKDEDLARVFDYYNTLAL